jgi:hypothetical protein
VDLPVENQTLTSVARLHLYYRRGHLMAVPTGLTIGISTALGEKPVNEAIQFLVVYVDW